MTSKSRIGKIAFAAALVAASGGAALGLTSIASASLGNGNPVNSVEQQSATAPQAVIEIDNAVGAVGRGRPRFVSETLAEALGMTVEELHEALRSGKTIAQIAEAQKVDIDDVKAAMLSQFSAHLDQHVADGDLTREQADARLAKFTERLDEIVNTVRPGKGGDHRDGRGGRPPFITENLTKVLEMTADELMTELRSGKTIAQIAEAQKVDIDDVKAAMIADFKAHLDEEVASGEHTQAEADEKLAEFTSRVDDIVNKVGPGKGGRGHDHSPEGGADEPADGSDDAPSDSGASFSA